MKKMTKMLSVILTVAMMLHAEAATVRKVMKRQNLQIQKIRLNSVQMLNFHHLSM